MAHNHDEAQINGIIQRFFEQFDTRGGKSVSLAAFDSLFSKNAIIVHDVGSSCIEYSVHEFLEPRITLLTSGELTNFHEWETSAVTHVAGLVASRISTYGKRGMQGAQSYEGKGTKFFQLAHFSERWRITALSWSDEDKAIQVRS